MKDYEHIIFDLDHTLWDFERNSGAALSEIYKELELNIMGIPDFGEFYNLYKKINEHFWNLYRDGKVEKEELRTIRFSSTLQQYGIKNDDLVEKICNSYLYKSPRKPHLIDGSIEVLNYLKNKYELHILTNGFAEIQEVKMNSSGLSPYFKHVIASEHAGAKKPHAQAFNYTLEKIGTARDNCIMIGDNIESDIKGAFELGMDSIYFNRDGAHENYNEATHQIHQLSEIMDIL